MDRADLRADCARCYALCCVAPGFAKGADFAIDKPGGTPCRNLSADFRCSIHSRLRDKGFPGCTVYDCFGAGQRVSATSGADWRSGDPGLMFRAFEQTRLLHELLWYLADARAIGGPVDGLADMTTQTERLAALAPVDLVTIDVDAHRAVVNTVLTTVSERVRGPGGRQLRGADCAGRSFRGVDLRRANLRGALLIGADLRGADLSSADVIGADFRGARVGGANLATALFLTQSQVDAAIGDAETVLPESFRRPGHW